VWLPPEPVSVHQILNDAGRITIAGDGDTYDEVAAEDFVHDHMECVASFVFLSDGVEVYLYRMHDKRCLICWTDENEGLVGIALLRDESVYPRFFEEMVASCGDAVHVIGWGMLPMELSVTVSPETLLRATLRFLTYADNAEAWNYYAALGRAGKMPLTLPCPPPAWLREQDLGYWQQAYEFVQEMIGFA
jgi:hypothetical protein